MINGSASAANHESGRAEKPEMVLMVSRSSSTLYTRDSPYFDSPNCRAWCLTLISARRGPAIEAIAGINRCISLYSGTVLITSARNAFSEHPLSLIGTPVTFPMIQFAIFDGIFRDISLSCRSCRQPTTISKPSLIFSTKCEMSRGSFCKSPSIVIIKSPRARSIPAAIAGVCP